MLHRICHASLTVGLSCCCCCRGRRATPAAAKVGRDQGRADRRLARQALPQPDLPPWYRRRDADRGDAGGGFAHVRQRAHRLVSGKGQGCFCVGANWLLFPPLCGSVSYRLPSRRTAPRYLSLWTASIAILPTCAAPYPLRWTSRRVTPRYWSASIATLLTCAGPLTPSGEQTGGRHPDTRHPGWQTARAHRRRGGADATAAAARLHHRGGARRALAAAA